MARPAWTAQAEFAGPNRFGYSPPQPMPGQLPLERPPQRILLIKPSSLGDIVHALPVLSLVKRRWPEAEVSWLVTPAYAGILEGHPLLAEVILFERRRLAGFWRNPRSALRLLQFARELRQRQFDLVIDLQGLFRSGWISRRTRSPLRVGFADARELAWLFYTQRVDAGDREQHAIDRNLKIAQALGCGSGPVEFPFPPHQAQRKRVDALLPEGQRIAVLLPGANWLTKRWPADRFAALVEPLRARFGLTCVIAGGSDAVELAPQIPGAVNLAGKTSLLELVALLERAELVVANDSGPMHIAAALGRPLVTMFAPTNPVRTGPYGRPDSVVRTSNQCSPCYRRQRWRCSCIDSIDVRAVLAAAEAELGRAANRHPQADPAQ